MSLTHTLARFVIRPGDQEGRGDLVLGTMSKEQNAELLKPGVVYEIREVMGYLMVMPIGEAHMGMQRHPGDNGICWGNDINHIIMAGGGRHLLTVEENAAMKEESNTRDCLED